MMTKQEKGARFGLIVLLFVVLFLICSQSSSAATGTVNFNTIHQQLEGFGGAIVYDAPSLTNHTQRETIYNLLFRDLGLDVLRIRNCVGYDTTSVNATKTIVSAARQTSRNPDLKLQMVPWSPPGYLKSTGNPSGGGTLAGGPSNYVYSSYAQWWYDSLNTWASGTTGLVPDYISIQNEPDLETSYDSCKFTPTETVDFAGYDKAFEAVYNKLYSQMGSSMPLMLAPETMGITAGEGGVAAYVSALNSRGQMNHIYGFSHHIYPDGGGSFTNPDGKISAMQSIAALGSSYNKPLFMTEYGADGTPTFTHAVYLVQHIYNCLVYEGVTSYYHWSLIRSGSSNSGGVITLDTSSHYIIRDLYYWLKHYMYFTDPGFYRVGTTTNDSNVEMTAFRSEDSNQLTIVIANISTSSKSLNLTINGFSPDDSEVYRSSSTQQWAYLGTYNPSMILPAQSITTIAMYYLGPKQTLTVSSIGNGSVTTPGEGSFQVLQNYDTQIVAEADPFNHFVEWTGTAVTAGKVDDPYSPDTTVYMDADYTVVAHFEADPPDVNPPSPNPMEWATPPTATGSTTITMTAQTASDSSLPVEYLFECINEPSKSSTWQTNNIYVASALNPLTEYSFRVRARDSYLTPNYTDWSSTESATTPAPSSSVSLRGSWTTGLSHTKEIGSDRVLVLIAHLEQNTSDNSLNAVTYGGQPMTKINDITIGSIPKAYIAAFIMPEYNISLATDSIFVPSWSVTPDYVSYSSAFFAGVDQSDFIGDFDSNSISTSTPKTIVTDPLSTATGDMVILGATCGNPGSYTLNNGFTIGTNLSFNFQATAVTGHKQATGIPEIPSATYVQTPNRQVITGFVLKASTFIDYPPTVPTGLTAAPGNETVLLNWDDNNEVDLAGYNIYRSTTQGSGYGKINVSPVTDSNYADNNVNNGIPYYYVVTATDGGSNESGYSNEVSATPGFQTCEDVKSGGFGFVSDITGDCYINMDDLNVIVQYWLNTDCSGLDDCDGADLEPDGDVDFMDYGDFVLDWLNCNNPQDSNCPQNW